MTSDTSLPSKHNNAKDSREVKIKAHFPAVANLTFALDVEVDGERMTSQCALLLTVRRACTRTWSLAVTSTL